MITIFSFVLISIFSCGSYFLHISYLKSYKKEFKAYIQTIKHQANLASITIPTNQLYINSSQLIWEDENKEIIYNGVLYDVVTLKTTGKTTILSVISDNQEFELKKLFASIYNVTTNKNTKGPNEILKTFFGLKSILNGSAFEFKNRILICITDYLNPIYKTVNTYISQETPPPNYYS